NQVTMAEKDEEPTRQESYEMRYRPGPGRALIFLRTRISSVRIHVLPLSWVSSACHRNEFFVISEKIHFSGYPSRVLLSRTISSPIFRPMNVWTSSWTGEIQVDCQASSFGS